MFMRLAAQYASKKPHKLAPSMRKLNVYMAGGTIRGHFLKCGDANKGLNHHLKIVPPKGAPREGKRANYDLSLIIIKYMILLYLM